MGYLVPELEKQMEQVFEQDIAGAFASPKSAEIMKGLANAYHEDPAEFNKNADKYFEQLSKMFREFKIQPENLERTQENFKETFHKLWKSISLAEDFKNSKNVYVSPKADVAKIYQNYQPVYDRILLEKDMHRGLQQTNILGTGLDHQKALLALHVVLLDHKTNEPFNRGEQALIKEAAHELNKGFTIYDNNGFTIKNPGLFSGESVKTPADLKKYMDNYDTMLRDAMKLNAKEFHLFAQGYQIDEEGETVTKLTEDDVKAINRKFYDAQPDAELEFLLQEFHDLYDADKVNAYAKEILSAFDNEIKKAAPQDVMDDPQVKEAQAAYDQTLETAQNDLEKINDFSHGKNLPKDVEYRYNDQYALKKIYDDFAPQVKYGVDVFDPIQNDELKDFNDKIDAEKASYTAYKDDAKNEFKKVIVNQVKKEIPKSNEYVQGKLKEIKELRNQMLNDPYHPEYQKTKDEMNQQIEFLKAHLKSDLTSYTLDRLEAKGKLKQAVAPYQKKVQDTYEKEKAGRIKDFNRAAYYLNDIRESIQQNYENTEQGKRFAAATERRNAAARENLCSQLSDICEAMNSVTKYSLRGNSSQYNEMLTAIKDYRENRINANQAHKACQDYLNLSLNDNGTLRNMNSAAGKIRKQSCVRMMELLEKAPDFKQPQKDEEKIELFVDNGKKNAKNVHKEKLNYETLKTSLAGKSGEVAANDNSKDAKAYSNLNAKLKEIKEAKKAAAPKAAEPVKKEAGPAKR